MWTVGTTDGTLRQLWSLFDVCDGESKAVAELPLEFVQSVVSRLGCWKSENLHITFIGADGKNKSMRRLKAKTFSWSNHASSSLSLGVST